jgi:hypothetical protein
MNNNIKVACYVTEFLHEYGKLKTQQRKMPHHCVVALEGSAFSNNRWIQILVPSAREPVRGAEGGGSDKQWCASEPAMNP